MTTTKPGIADLLRKAPVTAPVTDPEGEATTRADDRAHVLHSWSAQGQIDPLPIAGGKGAHFFDYSGNTFLDFGSQLINLNLGHGHPDLIEAIKLQAERLATVQPAFANDTRGTLARLICERAGERFSQVLFTTGGAEAVEHAIRFARVHTGRHKVMAAYRSYHGATHGSIALTGEARRWGSEPGTMPGVIRFNGPYPYRSPFHSDSPEQETERALQHLRQTILFENPDSIAAIFLESVVGSAGVLVPTPGYLAGVREICDEFGIMYVADEVMVGFGRVGEWFAFQAFDVEPDLITFAKGVNSGYVPLGGVVLSDAVAQSFVDKPYPGGLTYSGHPLACAPGVATVEVFERDGILDHVRHLGSDVLGPELAAMAGRHDRIGEVRGLGAFWAIEFVSDPVAKTPLDGAAMGAIAAGCKERGVWPVVVGNRIHVAPPLIATDDEVREGLAAIDAALTETA